MNGCQIMLGGRQHIKRHGDTLGSANQVQLPAKELSVLGGTIATIGLATHFFATSCSNVRTNGQRHIVYNKHLPSGKQVTQQCHHAVQPLVQGPQSSIEPRHTQRRNITQLEQNPQCSLVTVAKILSGNYRYRQYLSC